MMQRKLKRPALPLIRRTVAVVAVLIVLGLNAAKLLQGRPLTESDLISLPIVLIPLFHVFAWNSHVEERDEMGVSISAKSPRSVTM